ncbi:MAG: CsgG/HfaB family protein [Syntrophobacterales bacterium]
MPLLEARPDLGELLSAQIVETFKENGKTVVERERLLLALEELNIGTTSLVSKATQLELGRIVGAQLMLFGGYQIIGGVMRLDLRLVEVETGRTLKAVSMTAPAEDLTAWLNTAKAAAQELL